MLVRLGVDRGTSERHVGGGGEWKVTWNEWKLVMLKSKENLLNRFVSKEVFLDISHTVFLSQVFTTDATFGPSGAPTSRQSVINVTQSQERQSQLHIFSPRLTAHHLNTVPLSLSSFLTKLSCRQTSD